MDQLLLIGSLDVLDVPESVPEDYPGCCSSFLGCCSSSLAVVPELVPDYSGCCSSRNRIITQQEVENLQEVKKIFSTTVGSLQLKKLQLRSRQSMPASAKTPEEFRIFRSECLMSGQMDGKFELLPMFLLTGSWCLDVADC